MAAVSMGGVMRSAQGASDEGEHEHEENSHARGRAGSVAADENQTSTAQKPKKSIKLSGDLSNRVVATAGSAARVAPMPGALPRGFTTTLAVARFAHAGAEHEKERERNRNDKRLRKGSRFIIDPQTSKMARRWDVVMLLALFYTATVTPVEVAFLNEGRYITALWCVNRCVDVCFFCDMMLTFNMAYQEKAQKGGHWVHSRWLIAKHYVMTWFIPDLFTVIPFFFIPLDYSDLFGAKYNASAALTAEQSNTFRSATLFRILRMLKLARVFKAGRVIERHLLDIALHRWEWTFGWLKMLKLVAALLVYAHTRTHTLFALLQALLARSLPLLHDAARWATTTTSEDLSPPRMHAYVLLLMR